GSDKWGTYFLLINPEFYNSVFLKSIVERQLTFAGFIMFLIGLFLKRNKKIEFLFDWWLIAIIFFILFVSQGNLAQEYYQLPIVVPASVFIGKFLNKCLDFSVFKKSFSFKQKFISSGSAFLFIVLILLSVLRIENLLSKETKSKELTELTETVEKNSNNSDKIISLTQGNPVLFYNVNRKGWLLDKSEIEKIDSLKNNNAKLIIGDKKSAGDPALLTKGKYEIILNNNDFFCIKLN
ncbi:MAG TPA: hypothetical protein DIS94_02010, partial [Bacteroidetes bacterium]|nr:hypothetical protein [Bacteroidota bacterium]